MLLWTANFTPTNLSGWYAGRSAFLIGGGPSLVDHDLDLLRSTPGILTMGMNNSWSIIRPNLWCCVDAPGRFFDTGWKDPGIVKFVPAAHWNSRLRIQTPDGMKPSAFRVRQMPGVYLFKRSQHFDPKTYLHEDGVCWGGEGRHVDAVGVKGKRSVFMVALKLLVYLGIKQIYCVGTDFKMSPVRKYAFGQDRTPEAIRHNNELYAGLIKRMKALRPHLEERKVEVRVCCPDSGLLDAFDHIDFEEAVAKASRECSKPVDPAGWYDS